MIYNELKLKLWISTLNKEQLQELSFILLNELIFTKEIRYNPDEEFGKIPYWVNSGDEIIKIN